MNAAILRAILDRCRVVPGGLAAKLHFNANLFMAFRGGLGVREPAIEVILGDKADFGPAFDLRLAIYCRGKKGLLEVALLLSAEGLYTNLRPDEPLFSVELADPQCLDKLARAISGFGVEYACPPEPPKKRKRGRVRRTTPPC